MKVKIKPSEIGTLPKELQNKTGLDNEYEVLSLGDARRKHDDSPSREVYYLLVMPRHIGHQADATVDSWWVLQSSCNIVTYIKG